MEFVLAAAGLILYLLYDFGSVKGRQGVWPYLFYMGSALWLADVAISLVKAGPCMHAVLLLPAILFLLLTAYAVFFAIPFDGKALKGEQTVFTKGVYALCRHPGVMFLVIGLLFLSGAFASVSLWKSCLSVSVCNFLYAAVQDVWTFPKTLRGYDAYKHETRCFLITPGSVKKCLSYYRRNRHEG